MDRLSPAEIQAVPCPLCAADVGRPCVTLGRDKPRRIEYGHTERTKLAVRVVAALATARRSDTRIAGLSTYSKCDDHNKPCVCRQGCDCGAHHQPAASSGDNTTGTHSSEEAS